eukprot:GSMAST32.ASY1.ANO1.14.1 assembled CDS
MLSYGRCASARIPTTYVTILVVNFIRSLSSAARKPCALVLADGTRFEGYSFGADVSKNGEAVFNTGMVGYAENLTDPSGRKDKFGLPHGFESDKIQVQGLVVGDYCEKESHWDSGSSLGTWLKEEGIPAIEGIDTRALTQKLRDGGSQMSAIEFPGQETAPLDSV